MISWSFDVFPWGCRNMIELVSTVEIQHAKQKPQCKGAQSLRLHGLDTAWKCEVAYVRVRPSGGLRRSVLSYVYLCVYARKCTCLQLEDLARPAQTDLAWPAQPTQPREPKRINKPNHNYLTQPRIYSLVPSAFRNLRRVLKNMCHT